MKKLLAITALAIASAFILAGGISNTYAVGTEVVSPTDMKGWDIYSEAGGSTTFIAESTAPLGTGVLQLNTPDDVNAYTRIKHTLDMKLSDITTLSYQTLQKSAPDAAKGYASITLRLWIDTNGDGQLDDQLMYEPYWNGTVNTDWQTWNAIPGKYWSNFGVSYNGIPAVNAEANFTLADVLHDFPAAKVIAISLSMGTHNAPWTILTDNLKVNDTTYDFEPAQMAVCSNPTTVHSTSLSAWNLNDTKSKGHNEILDSGLHIWTDDNSSDAKAAGYYTTNFALNQMSNDMSGVMSYTSTVGIAPGAQLVVDFDNDGTPDGILVGETAYGNNWWLSGGSAQSVKDSAPHTGGGSGSNWYGTMQEWVTAFPNAQVKAIGYSLGSGVLGDGVITSMTYGCTTYTFGKPVVVPPTLTVTTPAEGSTVYVVENKLVIKGIFKDDVAPNYAQFELVKDGNLVTVNTMHAQYANLGADGSYTFELQVPTNLVDGNYSLFYTGTDFDGGVTDRMERKFKIIKNDALPVLTVITPAEGDTVSTTANGNKLTITGSFTDDKAPNYAQFQLVYKGNSVTLGTMYGYGSVYNPNATYANEDGTYTFDLAVPANLENGEYSLFYTGTDFENGITQRMERKFNINNSLLAPTGLKWMVDSTAIACGGTTNATITSPTWNAVSGASSYNYQFMSPGNSVWQDGGNYTNTTTGPTSFGTLDGVEGVWKFRVQTVDANGALSEWSEGCPVTFSKTNSNNTLDTTAPVVSITNPVEGSKANTDVEIRGSVVDDNPHHYWLNITRNGSIIYNKTVLEDKSFEDKLLYTATLEGEYVVTLAARDAVGGTATSGNRSENVVVKFTIDKSASTTTNEGGNTTPVIQSITSGGGGGGGLIFSPSFYNSTPANPTITPPTPGRVLGATVYQFTQDMKLGSVGPEVKALQKFLNAKGFIVSETGAGSKGNETEYFGLKTKLALIKYQKANDVILQRVEIFNNEGTGNFFWSTKQSANEMLSTDSETSTLLSQ